MSLEKLCDPLFQYVCRVNRAARKGAAHEPDRVRAELEMMFDQMKKQAATNPIFAKQYEQVELPLIFFVDFMIKESGLKWAPQWRELAYERNELAGDQRFFQLLDATLSDKSDEATDRLTIFYQCMGLGFTGMYTGQYELLRGKMLECSLRLSKRMGPGEQDSICPEAYQNINTSDLVEQPGRKLGALSIAFGVLVVTLFVTNVLMYRSYSADLRSDLVRIAKHAAWLEPADTTPQDPGM